MDCRHMKPYYEEDKIKYLICKKHVPPLNFNKVKDDDPESGEKLTSADSKNA